MKILMAGDTHGNINAIEQKMNMAKRVGDIQRMVVLGDFGIWSGYDGVRFLDTINEMAADYHMQIFAIKGNHEINWHDHIATAQKNRATSLGWCYVRSNVLLSPEVHNFMWGGKTFVVAGGAVSIDKQWRLEYLTKKGEQIWDKNEQLTDDQIADIASWQLGHVDYLLSHDCSNRTPFGKRLKPDIDSQIHRQRIDKALRITQPGKHFHGHMHERYEWGNLVGTNNGEAVFTDTYGLDCDTEDYSWGVLDLDTDRFTWGPDALQS